MSNSASLKHAAFDCGTGWIAVLASEKGLLKSTLPQNSTQEALKLLGDDVHKAHQSPDYFHNLEERLKAYSCGQKVTFPDELDLSRATPFQRQVWQITRLIPYGETRSYRWVAEQIGNPRAVRAVGQALGRNPLLIIIPCHRVVNSNGKLGGFGG
ncbi:MAG: methylated-DNA--[protein]-cysteine S-methyltransferase, partial [Chloroflexota bacterium]